MTPNCLRRMLEPYGARMSGYQGYHSVPAHGDGRSASRPRSPATSPPGGRGLVVDATRTWLRRSRGELCRSPRSSGGRRRAALPLQGRAAAGRPTIIRPTLQVDIGAVSIHTARLRGTESCRRPSSDWSSWDWTCYLERAGPDAGARAPCPTSTPSSPPAASGTLPLDRPAGHHRRLDHHGHRLRTGPPRRLRPPLLRRRRGPPQGQPLRTHPRPHRLAPARLGRQADRLPERARPVPAAQGPRHRDLGDGRPPPRRRPLGGAGVRREVPWPRPPDTPSATSGMCPADPRRAQVQRPRSPPRASTAGPTSPSSPTPSSPTGPS